MFTDPAETVSIESPLLPEFKMGHIIEIGWVQNCHKVVDFFATESAKKPDFGSIFPGLVAV